MNELLQPFVNCIMNPLTWKGRASRKEYIYFFIVETIIYGGIFLLVAFIYLKYIDTQGIMAILKSLAIFLWHHIFWFTILFILSFIYAYISSLAITAKRLHDINLPAILVLIKFIPACSTIFFFILMIIPAIDTRPNFYNKYGQNPNHLENE